MYILRSPCAIPFDRRPFSDSLYEPLIHEISETKPHILNFLKLIHSRYKKRISTRPQFEKPDALIMKTLDCTLIGRKILNKGTVGIEVSPLSLPISLPGKNQEQIKPSQLPETYQPVHQ